MAKIKRGRSRIRSLASKAKAPKTSQMSMNRKVTRDVYQAREVEQPSPMRAKVLAHNKAKMALHHSTLKPIRASAKGTPNSTIPLYRDLFSTDLDGWADISAPSGEVVWVSGAMELQNLTTGGPKATKSFDLEVGKTYRVEVIVSSTHTTNNTLFNIGTTSGGSEILTATFPRTLAPVKYTRQWTPGVTQTWLTLSHGFAGGTDKINSVIIYLA